MCDLDKSGDLTLPDKKVDLVLFTEIWEDLDELSKDPVVKITFESMRCVILMKDASVESCQFYTIRG
jgi:hypothetical protein